MEEYLLAIDAGTGSGRAVLFDLQGKQISVGQEEWQHLAEAGVDNSMGFDFDNDWPLLCRCIKQAINNAEVTPQQIISVSATSMREGIVVFDKNGNEIWAVANVDARASKQVTALKASSPDIEYRDYQQSGQTFALGALPRLLWLKEHHPELYDQVASVAMLSDWVLAKLSGVIATDPSNAGTTGIFSLASRNWAPEMAKEVGLNPAIFPPVVETGTKIGEVTAQAARDSGLSAGTAVVMGGGDVQLGAAGLGVVNLGDIAVLGGTFWQQVVNIDAQTPPPEDMSIRVNPHVITGLSQAEGITFFSGLVMHWFVDAFCHLEKQLAIESGIDPYAYMEELAQQVPVGSYDILPIFSDAMHYDHWYHAAPSFINLSLDAEKSNPACLFRSLQENACIVSAINLESIQAFSQPESRTFKDGRASQESASQKSNEQTIVFAGGASKGFLWPQILADVTGKRVKIPQVKEATSLGCAMAAGVGVGIFANIKEAADSIVRWEKEYQPNMENYQHYQSLKARWIQVYEQQLKLVDKGLTSSMWQAPGL
ncbi:autoinducer-2 kinase [Shewanella sp. UCD-KL12]|uniref:autoinducer-2 kinase n=1 Tax=Shewanella sp. UCD-KL12 TaxID=1917163 RepID=UPI000970877D|nr:autoinducer-2 kinase [Shewanella sp. UCD-KL12]